MPTIGVDYKPLDPLGLYKDQQGLGAVAAAPPVDRTGNSVDTKRPKIENPDGSFSTEETITIEADGKWVNIPTIVGGQRVGEDQAIELFKSGKNPAVGAFPTLPEAETAARGRSEDIGNIRGGGGDPQAKGLARLAPREEAPKPGGKPGTLRFVNPGQDKIDPTFRTILEATSSRFGMPLTVTSGYRSPQHPVEARKKAPGEHARGTASDISLAGMNEAQRAELVRDLRARGVKRFGLYSNTPNMLHVDLKDQTGGGDAWFMYDRTAKKLNRAPAWFRSLAGDGEKPGTAQTSKTAIVIDESFKAADPMGLYSDPSANPFKPQPQPKPEPQPVAAEVPPPAPEQPAVPAPEAGGDDRYKTIDAESYEQWKADWEARNRSGGGGGDVTRMLTAGNAQLGLAVREAVGMIPGVGPTIVKGLDSVDEWLTGKDPAKRMQEAALKADSSVTAAQGAADAKQWVVEEKQPDGTIKFLPGPAMTDPRSYLRGVVGSAPSTIATMGPTGLLARGAFTAALARGASPTVAAASAARTAMIAGGMSEGVLGGAETSLSVRQRIAALAPEVLEQSEVIRTLREGGMSLEDAVATVADDAATQAFVIGGVATAAFGGAGDRVLAKILAEGVGGGVAQRILSGGARGAIAEGVFEELPQSAAQQAAGNLGVQQVDPSQRIGEGVADAAVGGLAAGGIMGGGMGAAGGAAAGQPVSPPVPDPGPAAPPKAPTGPLSRALGHGESIAQRAIATVPDPAAPPAAPAPAAPPAVAAPPEGRPAVGATVRVEAEGIEPFMATVDQYADGEVLVFDRSSGEIYQVPLQSISQIAEAPTASPDAAKPAQPVLPKTVTKGMRANLSDLGWSKEQIAGMSPIVADTVLRENRHPDTAPIDPNDTAIEPVAPAAPDLKVEPPSDKELIPVAKHPRGAPAPGASVFVEGPDGRFAARVERYEGEGADREAVVVDDAGTPMQVPLEALRVSKLTEKEAEAARLKREPPVDRADAIAGVKHGRRVGKHTVSFPDDVSARIYDLGAERRTSIKLSGKGALDRDAVMPAAQRKLADELGVTPEGMGQIADDYRYRVERSAGKARSDLPTTALPVNPKMLKRFRADREQPNADKGQPIADSAASNPVEKINTPDSAAVDVAGAEAATSPQNGLPEPTDGQKEAGNYKLGHVRLGGLDLSIENPAGSTRSGTSRSGKAWSVEMKSHYGYIKRTEGKDGDHVDVFVKPGTDALEDDSSVFVVDQRDPSRGRFDEHKVMLGFESKEEAERAYRENYSKGWTGLGAITETTLGEFKAWLDGGDTAKPFADAGKKAETTAVAKPTTVRVGRRTFSFTSYEDASRAYVAAIEQTDATSSGRTGPRAPTAEIVDGTGAVVAHVSYNGRVWSGSEQDPENELLYDPQAKETAQTRALPSATAPEHVTVGVDDRELGQIVAEFKAAQAEMMQGEHPVSNIFQPPRKSDVVRLADKVKVFTKEHGWMTPAEARARIQEWKAHAEAQGSDPAIRSENSRKVVLSLFDLSGEWSKPWEEAGYQVYRFDIQNDPEVGDVNNFSTEFFGDWFGDFDGQDIYAILAANPCTDFAVSGARHFAAKDKDGRTVASVKLVHQTLRTIEYFKPAVWAIENPVGRIEDLGGLPPWRLSFDPNHMGDNYTKKTLLWGRFDGDLPVAPVEATEGSKMHRLYGGKSQATKNARSVTPEGFSYGFFMANNAHDHPAMALANKFDRLDRSLIEKAVASGVSPDAITEAVEDLYYMDLDDAAANAAIRALMPPPGARKAESQKARKAEPAPPKRARERWGMIPIDANTSPVALAFNKLRSFANALSDADYDRLADLTRDSSEYRFPQMVGNVAGERTVDLLIAEWSEMLAASPAGVTEPVSPPKTTREGNAARVDALFASNKLFTVDKVEAARARLKSKMGQINSGIDPEVLIDGMTIAGAYIEAGVRSFADYARRMTDDFGPRIRPYLLSFWEGARNYPGLDTAGMTDVAESARLHAELNREMPSEEAAALGSEVKAPKRTKKTGRAEDRTLTQDWGVDHIDGYGTSPDRETGNDVKDAFLKDAAQYLQAVAGILVDNGFVPREDAKGRPMKPVSKNEAGPAVSGEVWLHMRHTESGEELIAQVGGSSLRGVVPTTPSGISVMYRMGRTGINRWAPTGLSAGELAAMMVKEAGGQIRAADIARPAIEAANETPELDQGSPAALEGQPSEPVRVAERSRNAGRGTSRGGQPDLFGSEPARAGGDDAGRGLAAGQDAVSVPAGRAGERPAATEPAASDDAGPDRSAAVADASQSIVVPAQERPDAYTITDDDALGEGGAKTKFRQNIAAIEILRTLEQENRPATRSEQASLAKWVGWGGLRTAFYRENGSVAKGWDREAARLKELLTPEEYRAAEASSRNAHYTSPEVVKAIWSIAERLGFTGGLVLEPSVGAGNFIGLMPPDLRKGSGITGVELDRITGGVAKNLYPQANIQAPMGFQDLTVPDGYFDLAIGNPPFGSERLYDADRRELNKFSIHNYFFAKSVDALRPGGVLAMVVTNYFLDATDAKARAYIAARADLLGAIRLPNNAFLKNAGTEVTTDIIVLQKRAEGAPASDVSWVDSSTFRDEEGREVALNRWFKRHPDMMLGKFGAYGTMYRGDEAALIAREDDNLEDLLEKAITRLPERVMPAPRELEQVSEEVPDTVETALVGSAFLDAKGALWVRKPDSVGRPQAERLDISSEKGTDRIAGLVRIRDAFTRLRRAQISDGITDADLAGLRDDLNQVYDAFVKANGPINADANKRLFRDDPSWPQVAALETDFDKGITPAMAKKTGEKARPASAKKAAIFRERTQRPYSAPTKATSAKDALVQVLDQFGRVDLGAMSRLYGKTADAIVSELGDLLYKAPDGSYETADAYLTGNVRHKLAAAEKAAETDSSFRRNVEALRGVIPVDIPAIDIDVKAGAPWVPANHVADFVAHIAERAGAKAFYSRANAKWLLENIRPEPAAQAKWGTDRASLELNLVAALNGQTVTIYDKVGDKSEVNQVATEAANEKVQRIKDEWGRWIWTDDARREALARLYNDTFNTDVERVFDGSHLTMPGKVADDVISFRPHQKNFVWRAMQSSTVLADHTVGAGKTFAAVASVMEKRRIGQWRKPLVVVPNHLVGQWAADFVKLYPGARVLAATKKDFEAETRKRFFARMATGDWDAIIVSHSSFGRIGVDPEYEAEFIQRQISDLEASAKELRDQTGKDSRSVAQLNAWRANMQAKLQKLLDAGKKDVGLTFNEIGIDGIVVDEAHEFKNLGFATSMTRVAGLGNPQGSQKAADLYIKTRIVMDKTGGRNVMFLTGTPISNTMAEMFTVQRYLDEAALRAMGIQHFDAWAKVFGEVVTDWELSPSGQYKLNSRFARFVNMPELMQRYRSFADVITNDDIQAQLAAIGKRLPIPKVKGGKPENVVVERSPDQALYIGVPTTDENGTDQYPKGSLVWRAENLPKKAEKGADNMLKVMSDARKAALDMRLIDAGYGDYRGSKVHGAADRIKALYDRWADARGTQLVFIDLSTPKAAKSKEVDRIRDLIKRAEEGDDTAQEALDAMSPDDLLALDGAFSVYDDLRAKLIDRGIPAEEIAFIHDANTDAQKEELFGKVRSGRVRLLFGSTAKMGAGTNVQTRLVGLHHLDAPWRPSDLEQREGRIIRQGNELYAADPDGFEVEINRYATKNTLDARMWQTIEAKAKFIAQVRKGTSKDRVIEDIAGEAANAAEMKAAASGNPLILEEMDLRQRVKRLENAAREHDREQHAIADRIRYFERRIAGMEAALPAQEADAESARAARSVEGVTVTGTVLEKPKEVGTAILAAGRDMIAAGAKEREIGAYGPFKLVLAHAYDKKMALSIEGATEHEVIIEDVDDTDATGLYQRMRNTVAKLMDAPDSARDEIATMRRQIPGLAAQRGDFTRADELAAMRQRHGELLDQLKPKPKPAPAAAQDPAAQASIDGDWPELGGSDITAMSDDDRAEVERIIREVSGLSEVAFRKRIALPKGSEGWGSTTPTTASGLYSPGVDAIAIALNASNPSRVAYHEAFHRLQNLFLTDDEKAILRAELGRLRRMVAASPGRSRQAARMSAREIEAEAFAIYASEQSAIRPHKALRAAWDRMTAALRRILNYLAGRGFRTAEDIFTAARAGAVVQRMERTENQNGYDAHSLEPEAGSRVASTISDLLKKPTDWTPAALAAVPLNYFSELKRPGMTAIDTYLRLKRQMDTYRGKKHAAMDAVAQDWRKYARLGWGPAGKAGKARAAHLADLMHESTLAGIDPSSTSEEMQKMPGYDLLRARYLEMPESGRHLYKKVRDAYTAQAAELDAILLDNIRKAQAIAQDKAEDQHRREVDRINRSRMSPRDKEMALADAEKAFAAVRTRSAWSMKARLTRMRTMFEASRVQGPYFPLARFGRYTVTVRDIDGTVLSFSKRETVADRDRLAAQMKRDYPDMAIDVGVMDQNASARDAMDPRLVAEIETILGGAGLDPKALTMTLDQIWQRYLETLPDLSTRKRFIHRKGTAGFDADALRAFASHMFHAAHQMGRLKYGIELAEMVNRAGDQARQSDDPTRGVTLVNELRLRHEWVMNPKGGKFAQSVTSAMFVWYLGATPAAAVVNLTQSVLVGIPVLGSRLGGLTRAGAALTKAAADAIAGRGSITGANLPAEEKRAVEAFYDSGLIDRTQSHDLAGVGETGVEYSPVRARVMAAISWMFHRAEVANREITALAAYRMARAQGQSEAQAIDTAHDLTWKTHFDYANSSRARILQNDTMKVLATFQNYQLNMWYRIFRDAHQSLKGESWQVRKEARLQLAGMIGMISLLGGIQGVFGYSVLVALAGLFLDDDEDPRKFKEEMAASVREIFGPRLGGMILRGVPGELAGIDLTSRIGMPDLFIRPPDSHAEGRDWYRDMLVGLMGVSGQTVLNIGDGLSLISDGNVARGAEVIAPKSIKDLMQAYRYANEGILSRKGDPIIERDNVKAWDVIAEAMGFTSAHVAERYENNRTLKDAEQRVLDERRELINRFALAAMADDAEGRAKAVSAIKAFNAKPYGKPIPIKADTLRRSLKTRATNSRKRVDGVLIQNERLGHYLRELAAAE
jgi:N12 class adenine-specific DNA methylase/predicted RNA methylase